MGRRAFRVAIIAGALLAAAGGVLVARGLFAPPPELAGTLIEPPMAAEDFTLTSRDGPVSLSDFRGRTVVLFFGYTYCPDVCPLTLAGLGQAVEALGDAGEEVQVIMVSVDPDRDTPERVGRYAANFHPSFLGLTGTAEEVGRVATAFGIYHGKDEPDELGDYMVSHSATVTVLGPEGRIRLLWPYDVPPEDLARDLRYLVGA